MDEKYVSELTAALYRVTDRMDDREPLKWRMRERALGFERLFVERTDLRQLQREDTHAKEIISYIEEIVRMLKLCSSLFIISKINFEMLIRGYEKFRSEQLIELPEIAKEAPKVNGSPEELHGRHKRILEILETLDSASVKDLAERFGSEVSEKTLQRDLNDLIYSRSIVTIGERRWRRYKVLRT